MLSRRRFAALPALLMVPAVQASTPAATPDATPDLPRFTGKLVQIWTEPWEVEGKLLTFKGVIMERTVAPRGSTIAAGEDGDPYRSLIHLYVPLGDGSANELYVASDSDLANVRGRKTIEVTGTYGGFHQPGSTRPLIIATEIKPAS